MSRTAAGEVQTVRTELDTASGCSAGEPALAGTGAKRSQQDPGPPKTKKDQRLRKFGRSSREKTACNRADVDAGLV